MSYHYQITPYNYKPKIAQKITSESFYDLGQGLLDLLYDLDSDLNIPDGEKKML